MLLSNYGAGAVHVVSSDQVCFEYCIFATVSSLAHAALSGVHGNVNLARGSGDGKCEVGIAAADHIATQPQWCQAMKCQA